LNAKVKNNAQALQSEFGLIQGLLSPRTSRLAFGALYAVVFMAIGGGWALSGPDDCHFQVGVIGYFMLLPPVLVMAGLLWLLFKKF